MVEEKNSFREAYTVSQSEQQVLDATSDSVIKFRLDVNPVLHQFELWLRGSIVKVITNESGIPDRYTVRMGVPKANEEGVENIMTAVKSIFNSMNVQANYTKDGYSNFIADFMEDFACDLFDNLYRWGINENDYLSVCHRVFDLVAPFMTRTIDNLEREGYKGTIGTHQVMSNKADEQKSSGGFMKFINRGG